MAGIGGDGIWNEQDSPLKVVSNAIPMILPSSGTIGNNGALSAITSVVNAHPSCYMYFPANAIAAGVAAGLYYVVMSSPTAGTIYNNTYTDGKPTIPTTPTAFVTTGPGAYVQTTATDITLLSTTLTGGAMGKSGQLIVYPQNCIPATAGAKSMRVLFGGTTIMSLVDTTSNQECRPVRISNRDSEAKQVATSYTGFSAAAATPIYPVINTAADVVILNVAQIATATDFVTLESVLMEVFYGD